MTPKKDTHVKTIKKILIVEDQADILKLLEIIFKGDDREIHLVKTGDEALAVAREIVPDVILMDIMLPGGIDGYEVTRTLKSDSRTSSCAVIAMTAKVQEQDKQDAWAAGVDEFIGKPYRLDDLKEKVQKFLE
ncbi:MAG: two-component system response regulator [Desulfuromonas sp.]|nr:MAG: two-component system response regulator [Desulfuromonas sp.]